ncbi:hypothetical protein DID88_007317 [Monilinia fructigena]|uniref:Uncharacterized protein n=1 Tax=Monilinia fructigena TaxID=38457 RepID=A0A395JCX6_9HELO|nr:hypothetical protein DID88_007317 [Monilinia fructigena]
MYRPFKPCPRTDCVENQTKHAQLILLLKEAKEKLEQKEGLLRASIAQTESYDQRLQAAHTDLKAYDTIAPQLEVKYIEEKKRNDYYSELKNKDLELKQTMEEEHQKLLEEQENLKRKIVDQRREYEAIIKELQQRIYRLEQHNSTAEEYIEKFEASRADEQQSIAQQEERIMQLEHENRELTTRERNNAREIKIAAQERNALNVDNESLRWKIVRAEQEATQVNEFHEAEKENLLGKIRFEQTRLENYQNDTEGIQKQAKEAQEKLAIKEAETVDLTHQLKEATDRTETGGDGQTEEQKKALEKYSKMARDLINQVQDIHQHREPQFSRKPGAYRTPPPPRLLLPKPKSTHDEQEEAEEDLSPDLQLIHRARRGRGGHTTGPAAEPIIQIKEVEVIREVQVPGPSVEIPSPIQYVNREVPVPGPILYVDVEGDDMPTKIRYTPFRVFAHNPIICWLLVEFNFLILFAHWAQRLFVLLSWAYAQISGGEAWIRPVPDYASSSSETGSNVTGAPPQDSPKPQLPRPGVFTVLFNPKPGRIPSAWDTLWGLAFHFLVYSTLWLSFSVWHERGLWLAQNEGARRWLHQLIAQRSSDGFLGMNQILPQTVNRQLDILRFDLLELVGIPVTYRSPG